MSEEEAFGLSNTAETKMNELLYYFQTNKSSQQTSSQLHLEIKRPITELQ